MHRPLLTIALVLVAATNAFCQTVDKNAEKARAEAITKQIGELASSGKLPTSEEGIELLKKLVDELSDIRKRLDSVEATQKPSKTTLSGFIQFQYRNSTQDGAANAFQIRRARLNLNHQADEHTLIRLSADFATGTNQLQAQLKDAFALYTFPGQTLAQAEAGQFSIPISFQLTRSDMDREFPERTNYMSALFNGERSRGAFGRVGFAPGASVFLGAVDSLTINDPEQANLAPGVDSKIAGIGGVGYAKNGVEGSLSGIVGKRPSTTNGATPAPETDHNWLIANLGYDSPTNPWTARAEFMAGKDRVPGTTNAALINGTDQQAWHLQLGYRLSPVDMIFARYEDWNRDTNVDGFRVSGWGIGYRRDLTSSIRFVGSFESFDDRAAKTYTITTVRLQYRF